MHVYTCVPVCVYVYMNGVGEIYVDKRQFGTESNWGRKESDMTERQTHTHTHTHTHTRNE